MHSEIHRRTKSEREVSDAEPILASTKLAAAGIRGALMLAVLSTLLLLAARPAQAQTEFVLHNFTGGSDGGNPNAGLTFDSAGNLYGTTTAGGLGYGTVYELSPNGSGGWNETVLYSCTGARTAPIQIAVTCYSTARAIFTEQHPVAVRMA
ncbi:MAG: choice-of-anchor tandem repeat GloVer-containing protein [Terriglobales bacterium]|jgi:hypothetical protein